MSDEGLSNDPNVTPRTGQKLLSEVLLQLQLMRREAERDRGETAVTMASITEAVKRIDQRMVSVEAHTSTVAHEARLWSQRLALAEERLAKLEKRFDELRCAIPREPICDAE